MWSRASNEPCRQSRRVHALRLLAVLALVHAAGCRTPPLTEPTAQPLSGPGAAAARNAPAPGAAAPGAAAPGATGTAAATPAGTGAGAPAGATAATATAGVPAGAPHPEVPPAARADFQRAVNFMRSGNLSEAELGFKQVSLQYPQFAAPLVNLAILQRKAGQLEEAEKTLKSAIARESGSAVAWTELGVTQRLRGEFKEAAASYEQAIAADEHYAPAWRNLGVVCDLYLDDPQRALKAFEQYKQLTGEEKPVNGWIAELRQRLKIAPVKPPTEAEPAAPSSAPAAAPAQPPQAPPAQSTPQPGSPAPAGAS
jgi:tetratricopeptide (TPR) repeat protein